VPFARAREILAEALACLLELASKPGGALAAAVSSRVSR
jgi:hypothetical protein